MRKHLLLLSSFWLLAACAGNRREVRLTSEPSIERALDIVGSTGEGRPLLKFLYKNPARFEYANTPGTCHKFSLKTREIFLPLDYKGSDLVLALALARAAYIYRLYTVTGLDEVISEEEELGAIFQARLALELNLMNADFEKAGGAAEIKNDFCTYVLENPGYAMAQARRKALSPDPDCQRPRETLENQRVWLEKTLRAINEETFYQLLYERDMARVRKGVMPASAAMKNDAVLRAMPTYEVYRYQRTFYDRQSDSFSRFGKTYTGEIKKDSSWRAAHREELDRAREEFSACNLVQ
ncbi:MAG: hypothetical protein HY550_02520 [Elusimicrobia bacterium]|nr:hypothetical protein [Elusimicrobiota bacterium]